MRDCHLSLSPLRFADVRNTSTFRLTGLLGLVGGIGLAALVLLIYLLSAQELTARTDRILDSEAALLSDVSADTLPNRVRSEIARNTSGLTYLALQSPDGEHVAGNLRAIDALPIGRHVNVPASPGRHPAVRVLAVRARTGETILIGRDITPILDLRHRVTIILVASGVAIALLVLVVGAALSLAPLRRVRDLRESCALIAAGRLDHRMPVGSRGDELDLFATTVNAMVDEVARVVAQVKQVTDAVAHDLRTPLTHVRGKLHAIARHPATDPATAALAVDATRDLDAALERFAALLRIAELEAAGRRSGFAHTPLVPIAVIVRDLYEPLAEERGVTLDLNVAGEVTLDCDGALIVEALSNLVDNAIKFTPAGGHVSLTVEPTPGGAILSVRDDGPGIAADERQAVLRRFWRGAAGAGVPGSGLGLSVVAAIAHLHGIALDLDDARPGLLARLRFEAAVGR